MKARTAADDQHAAPRSAVRVSAFARRRARVHAGARVRACVRGGGADEVGTQCTRTARLDASGRRARPRRTRGARALQSAHARPHGAALAVSERRGSTCAGGRAYCSAEGGVSTKGYQGRGWGRGEREGKDEGRPNGRRAVLSDRKASTADPQAPSCKTLVPRHRPHAMRGCPSMRLRPAVRSPPPWAPWQSGYSHFFDPPTQPPSHFGGPQTH